MRLVQSLRVFVALVRIRLSRQMSDPAGYWAAFFVDTSVFVIQAASFAAIYLNVDTIRGWDAWRSLFFVGTFTLIDGLFMASYFFGLIKLPREVESGRLDLVLSKPVSPLLLLSFDSINPGSLFLCVPALAMIVAAVRGMGMVASPFTIASYAVAVLLMTALVYELMVLWRCPVFWLTRANPVQEGENLLMEFAFRLPGSLYSGLWRLVFRVFLPYGLIATFPSEVFFAEANAATWLAVMGVVVVFSAARRFVWARGLARYSGAGG